MVRRSETRRVAGLPSERHSKMKNKMSEENEENEEIGETKKERNEEQERGNIS